MKKTPSTVPGLDALLHGGIPDGRTTLIAGRSGTGKSILALQISCAFATRNRNVLYVSVEERSEDLLATGDSLGFDTSKLSEAGRFSIFDIRSELQPIGPSDVITGDFDLRGLAARIANECVRVKAEVLVIDSLGALFDRILGATQRQLIRARLFELLHAIESLGLTALVTAEAGSDDVRPTALGVEDYVCDTVLVLRNRHDGKRRRRTIEVHKYRRSAHQKGEYPCTITDRGLTIFPLDVDPNESRRLPAARFSSGLAGLDAMNHGGWLRDAIVLVRGPSGSGKTTLAGMYAKAGAERSERVVYYGFEEPKGILLRNFDAVGMNLDAAEASNHLRIVCRYPEATSPEDLLLDLRHDLDAFDPSLVVLDSISSIEHSTSIEGFRVFTIGLSALLRQRNRSALLTQTISARSEAQQDPPFISTVADAILMLDYTADARSLDRTMRVLKMRGSDHDSRQYRLTIRPGGLQVEPIVGNLDGA